MKKRVKSLGSVLAGAVGLSLVVAACGNGNGNGASPAASPSVSTASAAPSQNSASPAETAAGLDKATLVFYLLGDQPQDGPAVMAEINKKLEADINATIEVKYIPFGDVNTKYPLVLASSQDWDVIYGSINYASNAAKGAYREIPMADVEKYMPLTAAATSQEQWRDTLINGKTFMIPQSFKELGVGAQFYREDLRKKYNVPEIKKPEDLEAYFEAIKANEKGMLPIDGTSDDAASLFQMFLEGWGYTKGLYNVTNFNPDDDTYRIKGLLDPEFVTQYKAAATIMKRFYDKGYLPKNAFAQKTKASDLSKAGKTGLWNDAFENYPQFAADMQSNGWELGALPHVTASGTALQRPSTGNGFSISPQSKNYERALMALDLLNQDKAYNMLLAFGIEGKNYVIQDDGKLAPGPGIDAANNPYPMYGAGWWANNRDQWPPLENYTQGYIDMKKTLQDHAKSYLIDSFNVDTESIKTEMANITNVLTQYEKPIRLGMVKNVDQAVDDLIVKLKKAGAEKVVEEFQKQIDEYVASKSK